MEEFVVDQEGGAFNCGADFDGVNCCCGDLDAPDVVSVLGHVVHADALQLPMQGLLDGDGDLAEVLRVQEVFFGLRRWEQVSGDPSILEGKNRLGPAPLDRQLAAEFGHGGTRQRRVQPVREVGRALVVDLEGLLVDPTSESIVEPWEAGLGDHDVVAVDLSVIC